MFHACDLKFLPRILNTTRNSTKKHLVYDKFLPPSGLFEVTREAERVRKKAGPRCPVLLLHSIDDRVSSYDVVSEYCKKLENYYLVTFRGLGHFLQFDMSNDRIRSVILEYFKEHSDEPKYNEERIFEEIKQAQVEHNEWAGIIFKLIIGYVTALGVTLYLSLEQVIALDVRAPYYLVSYSLITNIYVSLLILYFYFLNRTSAYLRNFLELLVSHSMGYGNFKSNSFMSGNQSSSITAAVSTGMLWVPFCISIFSMVAVCHLYSERIFEFSQNDIVLKASLTACVVTFLFVLWSLYGFVDHSRNELRRVHRANYVNPRIFNQILELYAAVRPGSVETTAEIRLPAD